MSTRLYSADAQPLALDDPRRKTRVISMECIRVERDGNVIVVDIDEPQYPQSEGGAAVHIYVEKAGGSIELYFGNALPERGFWEMGTRRLDGAVYDPESSETGDDPYERIDAACKVRDEIYTLARAANKITGRLLRGIADDLDKALKGEGKS